MANNIDIIIKAIDQASKPIGKVKESLDGAGKGAKSTGKSFGEMAASFAKTALTSAAVIGALTAVTKYLVASGAAAARLAEINAKQNAILTATGHAAGQTAASLDKMAREMTRVTEIELGLVKESQSLLLTFRNIGGDIFPRAMEAAADLSTTFGGLNSATMQLGKALNDPVAGITALNRAGVTFSKTQKEQIKLFVETGEVAKAQAIILAEVEAQVGGTAKAIAAAGDGSARLKNSLADLQAEIGRNVLPMQQKWNNALADTIDLTADIIRQGHETRSLNAQRAAALGMEEQAYAKLMVRKKSFREQEESIQAVMQRSVNYSMLSREQLEKLGVQFDVTGKSAVGMGSAIGEATEAVTKANQEWLRLVDTMSKEVMGANQKAMAIQKERSELETQLAELYRKNGNKQTAATQEIIGKLKELDAAQQQNAAETELASKRRILAMLEQQMSMDGLTESEMQNLENLGIAWGVYSEEGVAAARAVREEAQLFGDILDSLDGKTISVEAFLDIIADFKKGAVLTGGGGGGTFGGGGTAGDPTPMAEGGAVRAQTPYLIGEVGPELFVPSTSGVIVPNHELGGNNITINVSGAGNPETVANEIMRQLKRRGVRV